MRSLSVLFALAYLAGNAVFAFLMIFFATFPFENQSPEDAGKDDWLIGVAVILFVLALVTALAILVRHVAWAVVAYVAAAGVGIALLVWAVDESEQRRKAPFVGNIHRTGRAGGGRGHAQARAGS